MSIDLAELRNLPVQEELRVIEQLREDIAASKEEFPFPDWVQAETIARRNELKSKPEIALTREEAWKRVDRGQA